MTQFVSSFNPLKPKQCFYFTTPAAAEEKGGWRGTLWTETPFFPPLSDSGKHVGTDWCVRQLGSGSLSDEALQVCSSSLSWLRTHISLPPPTHGILLLLAKEPARCIASARVATSPQNIIQTLRRGTESQYLLKNAKRTGCKEGKATSPHAREGSKDPRVPWAGFFQPKCF